MSIQNFALDGTRLPTQRIVEESVVITLKLKELPKGLIGLNLKEGLAKVIQTANKQPVFMKLGKVLQKHGLTDKQVREASQILKEIKLICNNKVSFATTEEEVLRVYRNGPKSCMNDCDSVRIYASEDTAVAYLEVSGKILARAVVCTNEDIGLSYASPYGFIEPIEAMLKIMGYVSGDLEGCELPLIREGDRIVCPYLDGCTGIEVHEDREVLEVDSCGDYQADSTDGYLTEHTCGCCGYSTNQDDLVYSDHMEVSLCDDCFLERHINIDCEYYHLESDDITRTGSGEFELTGNCVYVEYREDYYLEDDTQYNSYTQEYVLTDDLS